MKKKSFRPKAPRMPAGGAGAGVGPLPPLPGTMPDTGPAEGDQMPMPGMKKGGGVKRYAKGGGVAAKGAGIAKRGFNYRVI